MSFWDLGLVTIITIQRLEKLGKVIDELGLCKKIKKSKFEGEIYYIDSKKKKEKKNTPILRKG